MGSRALAEPARPTGSVIRTTASTMWKGHIKPRLATVSDSSLDICLELQTLDHDHCPPEFPTGKEGAHKWKVRVSISAQTHEKRKVQMVLGPMVIYDLDIIT